MCGAVYSRGTTAWQEPGHSRGLVATHAQRDEGREWSGSTVGERIGKSRLPWEEPWISVNGDLTSIFSIGPPARTLAGQITEKAGRQGDPSVWSMPVSLGQRAGQEVGLKGQRHGHSASHISHSVKMYGMNYAS